MCGIQKPDVTIVLTAFTIKAKIKQFCRLFLRHSLAASVVRVQDLTNFSNSFFGQNYYYVYFSKTSCWNCLFFSLTFYRIKLEFLDFWSRYCIFLVKENIFNVFGFSVTIFVLLLRELIQHTWFGWCIPNIYTSYLLGKFGPKN